MSHPKEEKTIGEIIAEARKNSGLSLRAVASRIQINYSYLADIEKNRRSPSERVLKSLSTVPELILDFDFLMAYKGKLSQETENYLKLHPAFGKLISLITEYSLNETELNQIIGAIQSSYNKHK